MRLQLDLNSVSACIVTTGTRKVKDHNECISGMEMSCDEGKCCNVPQLQPHKQCRRASEHAPDAPENMTMPMSLKQDEVDVLSDVFWRLFLAISKFRDRSSSTDITYDPPLDMTGSAGEILVNRLGDGEHQTS